MTGPPFYVLLPSAFGVFGLIWYGTMAGARVERILLPDKRVPTEQLIRQEHPKAVAFSCTAMDDLAAQMQCFLEGDPVQFRLEGVALERCSEFQQRVLRAEHGIPRG